jgi:hypothetical protein
VIVLLPDARGYGSFFVSFTCAYIFGEFSWYEDVFAIEEEFFSF